MTSHLFILSRRGSWIQSLGCLAIWAVLTIAFSWSAQAHLGQKNIVQQSNIGEYPARITIKTPDVIPGIAEIYIRFEDAPDLEKVTVLPVQSDLGKKGSPPPDPAKPVSGVPGLYEGELWIMTGVPHSVQVHAKGPLGEGTVFVPFTPMATNTPEMGFGMKVILIFLLVLLISLLLAIIRQAVLSSTLKPGSTPTGKRTHIANAATALSFILIILVLTGGKKWWDSEERHYTNNRLYSPAEARISVHQRPVDGQSGALLMRLDLSGEPFSRRGPLVPDHGKLVHVFVIPKSESSGEAAHLHPVRYREGIFWSELPALPAGEYHVFADVSHETGYAQTFVGSVSVPAPEQAVDASVPDSGELQWLADIGSLRDPEDSWLTSVDPAPSAHSSIPPIRFGDGLQLVWTGENAADPGEQLRFEITDEQGRPIQPEPYLGMAAHAAVVGKGGSIYTHLHPAGSVSMAAMQLFELRDAGLIPSEIGRDEPLCTLPSVDESQEKWLTMTAARKQGEIIFPYLPPEDGTYRVWVQFKIGGTVHTVFTRLLLEDGDDRRS